MKNTIKLAVKWTVSKAQDTYGYNICTVQNADTSEKFKSLGGGYDLLGSSIGKFIESTFQSELLAIKDKAYYVFDGKFERTSKDDALYGFTLNVKDGVESVSLDGACGISSMESILNAMGYTLERVYNLDRKGRYKNISHFYIYANE